MSKRVLTFLMLCFTSAAFAEDFKTVNGKEYKDATVSRVEPDGIVLKTKSGIIKVYFTELPKDVRERFHYDSAKATSYSSKQVANYAAYQNQQEQTRRQQADADAKNRATLMQPQTANNRIQGLQDSCTSLQQQEESLLQQIEEAEKPGPVQRIGSKTYQYPNPQKSQVPILKSRLADVRHEKSRVRRQLEKAQDR